MLSLKIVLIIIIFMNTVLTSKYYRNNATSIFDFFKEKYHKTYTNYTLHENALKNFIKNLNMVTELNEKSKSSDVILILNKFADLDTDDVEEHYALKIIPYDNDTLHRELQLPANSLRNRIDIKPDVDPILEPDYLYDLDEADKVYKGYMRYFNKKNATKKYDQTVNYYRFIKTLVELNREHYRGDETRALDENADVVKKPFEYIY